MVVLMIDPKAFPTAAFCSCFSEPPLFSADVRKQFLKHLQALGRLTFRFPHPFPRGTELTANPLSKCVCYCVTSLGQLQASNKRTVTTQSSFWLNCTIPPLPNTESGSFRR